MDLQKQRKSLESLKAEYEANVAGVQADESAPDQGNALPTISNVPTHAADAASELYDRESEEAFGVGYAVTLEQINHAIERLDAGTYRQCEVCGKEIPEERQMALPFATMCIEDQERSERI